MYHRTPGGWILEQRIACPGGGGAGALDGDRLLLAHQNDDAKRWQASLWERGSGDPPWRIVADLSPQTQDSNLRPPGYEPGAAKSLRRLTTATY